MATDRNVFWENQQEPSMLRSSMRLQARWRKKHHDHDIKAEKSSKASC